MTTRDALRAALWGAAFTFAGIFAVSMLGWLGDVASWASDKTGTVLFPDAGVLVKAAVAAAAAAATGLLNFVVRWAQSNGWVPGSGPSYTKRTTRTRARRRRRKAVPS